MQIYSVGEQLTLYDLDCYCGRMSPELSQAESQRERTSASSWRKLSELFALPFQSLDLTPGSGNLLGEFYWELISPWRGESSTLNTGVSPKDAVASSLSQILEAEPHPRYYLSTTACLGILRRASERGKELPSQLKAALMLQAGLSRENPATIPTNNVCRAFAANQRDEVRDLHDVAGALGAQPGMKQQTFVAEGCLTPWDTQQERIFVPEGVAPTMAGADGGGGRNPAGLLLAAAFNAGAGPGAGGIGYTEDGSPTLKSAQSGTNMVPAVLCLNDQGGKRMDLSKDVSGSLRSQEKGHQPLVLATQQGGAEIGVGICPTITSAAGTSGNNQPVLFEGHGHDQRYKQMDVSPTLSSAAGMGGGNIPLVGQDQPVLFENHGIDSRYTGPHPVAPTMSARYGTGGNNVPLVGQEEPETYCIVGNVIDRQPENGGNGKGYQPNLAYTLTGMDRHAVFSRQRTDEFRDGEVVSCESARQYKDATDLVMQETVGALTSSDRKGPNSQYVSQDKCVVEGPRLIRRLTPLECERLQGFPDGWTDIPGASDSARYKALGNSVAIPCVEYIMAGIAEVLGGAA